MSGEAAATAPPRPARVEDWTEQDVGSWLAEINPNFKQYCDSILDNCVNGLVLLDVSENDLVSEIGMKPMHAKRVVKEIESRKQQKSPPPNPSSSSNSNNPGLAHETFDADFSSARAENSNKRSRDSFEGVRSSSAGTSDTSTSASSRFSGPSPSPSPKEAAASLASVSDNMLVDPVVSNSAHFFTCLVCNKEICGEVNKEAHVASAKHRNKVFFQKKKNEFPSPFLICKGFVSVTKEWKSRYED